MRLSSDQKRGLDLITDWIKGKGRYFTLSGHAGTGKTTLVRHLLKRFYRSPWSAILVTAPTNKATKVLRSFVPTAYRDHCYTIHSAGGLVLASDKEEKYLSRRSLGRLDEASLLVIDEASMIDDYLFGLVERSPVDKILYVGDPYQLPPVRGESDSPAFDPEQVENVYQLREIVRQAKGHPVIELGDYFRRCLDGESPRLPAKTEDLESSQGLFFLRSVPWIRRYLDAVETQPTAGAVRALAWRNETVDELADLAHKRLYGDDADPFQPGQRVFTAKPYADLHTDDEVEIKAVGSVRKHPDFPDFRSRPLMIESSGIPIVAHLPDGPDEVEAEIGRLRQRALGAGNNYKRREYWEAYHAFRDAWADLRSVNALTVHRSQGSTFDDVFVDATDLRGSPEKYRLLYVACTRARNRVFIREG